eukprot:3753595-Rhodomonas_salina.1
MTRCHHHPSHDDDYADRDSDSGKPASDRASDSEPESRSRPRRARVPVSQVQVRGGVADSE